MRYYWRVFLWENGRRSTEYTKYTNAPIFLEDKLDETLDSGEIILMGMPIATKAAFPPKTKFRLERYNTADFSDTPKKWDMIVEHDDVEEYTGCPDLCTHRVHLIEASAVAQGMHVDNIALTYELQDVDLNYKVTKDDKTTLGNSVDPVPGGANEMEYEHDKRAGGSVGETLSFVTTYHYAWGSVASIQKLRKNYDGMAENLIEFDIPKLIVQGCYGDDRWTDLFEMSVRTIVRCYKQYARMEMIRGRRRTTFIGTRTALPRSLHAKIQTLCRLASRGRLKATWLFSITQA